MREQTVVNLFPALTVVRWIETRRSHRCQRKMVPVKLGRDRPDIGRDQTVVFLNPGIAVVALIGKRRRRHRCPQKCFLFVVAVKAITRCWSTPC